MARRAEGLNNEDQSDGRSGLSAETWRPRVPSVIRGEAVEVVEAVEAVEVVSAQYSPDLHYCPNEV